MESQLLERLVLGEMRSIVARSQRLVEDAERIFYEPQLPLEVLGEANRLKMELQSNLQRLVMRIQLEQIEDGVGPSVPFWRNRAISLYGAGPSVEPHGSAFEILFGAGVETNDTAGQCRIYTLDRRLNEQLPVSAELLNTAGSFGNVVELARILSLEKPPGLDESDAAFPAPAWPMCSPRSPLQVSSSRPQPTEQSDEYDCPVSGCLEDTSEPPLLLESPGVRWRPLAERIALQQQKREAIQQERLARIRQVNERVQRQRASAVEKQSRKIRQFQERQNKQLERAALQRREFQEQRVLHAALSAQKIEEARKRRQLERAELLEKIQRNWAENERRRREYRRAAGERRVQEAGLSGSQAQGQQVLWAGFDSLAGGNFPSQLIAALSAAQNASLKKAASVSEPRAQALGCLTALLDTAQPLGASEAALAALLALYRLMSQPGILKEAPESLSDYEKQLVFPQQTAPDVYIIPGLPDEALYLRQVSCALWRIGLLRAEKAARGGKFRRLFGPEAPGPECVAFREGALREFAERARREFPVYMGQNDREVENSGDFPELQALAAVLVTVLTEKLEFPALVGERFLQQAVSAQSKRLWLYDQLSSFQAAAVLLDQLLRCPDLPLPEPRLTARMFELVSTQCAQLVLSPHCYSDDSKPTAPGILQTHQPMILEFQGLLQTFLQLMNTLLERDAVIFEPGYLLRPENTQLRQELQFVFIYTQSQKVFFHPDSSPAAAAPAMFPVFLPRVSQSPACMILQQQSIEPGGQGWQCAKQTLGASHNIESFIFDATERTGRPAMLFTPLSSLAAYPINVASPAFTASGAEFLSEKAVHPGLLQALRFFKLLAQADLFERPYLRDFFQGALPLFPPELFVSDIGRGLLKQIAEFFLLDVGEV